MINNKMKYDVHNHDVCDNYENEATNFLLSIPWLAKHDLYHQIIRIILTHTRNLIQS